ncbi:MAG: lytic transglycosylase domain-containing protein [Kiloniellaceae bacterium]
MKAGLRSAVLLAWLAALPAWAHETGPPGKVQDPVLSARDQKIYKDAFRQAQAKRFRRARARAGKAENPLPAKVLQWLELTEPDPGGNFDEAAAFLENNADWPGQEALQRRAELAMTGDLPDPRVLAWFEARTPKTAEGAMRYAEALIRTGKQGRATALLRRTWVERDFTRRTERAFRKRFAKLLRREDELARLERLLWDRRFRTAKRQARRLGGGYPALAEARRLLAGMRPGVDRAVKRVPAALRQDPGLIFERARWRQRKRRYEGVIELLDPPNPTAPRPALWWPLRHWAAREALGHGEISVAYRIAGRHGLKDGVGFAEGESLAGWISLRFLELPQVAYRHFTRIHHVVSTPISLARSAFWAGEAGRAVAERVRQSNAHAEVAQWDAVAAQWFAEAARYDTTFYGQLARYRLGRPPVEPLPAAAAPGAEARAAFDKREMVEVVRMLGALRQRNLQERFLIRLRETAKTAADYALIAELAHDQKRPDMAVKTAKAARRAGFLLPSQLYPSLSLPKKPEPALVLALIRQESAFYSGAVSRSGARGLMQLLPGTAKRMARKIGVRYSRRKLTEDPDYNLRLGRAYLLTLTERYDGSYVLALAAYNAGPSRADRWIRDFGDPRTGEVDPIDWIESIPLNETRNYVQRVLESLAVYRRHLNGGESPHAAPRTPTNFTSRANREKPGDLSCCL